MFWCRKVSVCLCSWAPEQNPGQLTTVSTCVIFHLPVFISLTSVYPSSLHLSWIIKDGCRAEKHSKPNSIRFLVNFPENCAKMLKKILFLFCCALPPALHHLKGVSVMRNATVASNKCSFSVSAAAAVTSWPCQAELPFGEDSWVFKRQHYKPQSCFLSCV